MRKLNDKTYMCPDYRAVRSPGIFEEFDKHVKAAVCRVKGKRYADLKALLGASMRMENNTEFLKLGEEGDVESGSFLLVLS